MNRNDHKTKRPERQSQNTSWKTKVKKQKEQYVTLLYMAQMIFKI